MQATKILDITRSFVPVDPNTYPENLHGTGNEDDPEKRVPVVPYMGHNFLATGYGYKSFFGTNAALGIDSLAPNKPDHVFLFQTLAYKNILVALCDTGIWLKDAGSAGAWTQAVELDPPETDVFYEWYYVTIKNVLYAFRANGAAYYTIETDIAEALGVAVATVVPSFITPTAQLGMFRLGSRLGFWDAENVIAYSGPDDLSKFEPSVLTGANVTTFNAVTGKISAIRAHGNNALIYSSKGIVGLQIQPGETFFVKAVPILQDTGVPYARQSVAVTPDNTHFVYTTTGIYKIEDGKSEAIVPEVFDYLKPFTAKPIYLRFLQGRYLCFEIMDQDALTGRPLFSTGFIPETTLTFGGSTSLEQIQDEQNPDTFNVCSISGSYNSGVTQEQAAAADQQLPDKKPGTYATPLYTAYLSRGGAKDADSIEWSAVPCGFVGPNGTSFTMSPNIPDVSDLTTDSTNKTESYGPDAYTDGKWTMERFVQAQTALWKMEDQARQAVLSKIASRAFNEQKVETQQSSCVVSNTPAECTIGTFPSKFSAPQFGYNSCSFWLTRYCVESVDAVAKMTTTVACEEEPDKYWFYAESTGLYDTRSAAINAGIAAWLEAAYLNPAYGPTTAIVAIEDLYDGVQTRWKYSTNKDGNYQEGYYFSYTVMVVSGKFTRTTTASAHNELTPTPEFAPIAESAYCTLTHWKYTDTNGVEKIVPATACSDPTDMTPSHTPSPGGVVDFGAGRPNPISADGSMCGMPFEVPDLVDWGIEWPSQTITYPASSFLLQDGGIAPKYPDIHGFFCYDLHLKKWGKAKLTYKQLLDYSPINSESSSPVAFTNFGMLAGVIKDDGFIYIFDDSPEDSELTWGKIGYYRHGKTDIQSFRFDFASICTGQVVVDISLDGQTTVESLRHTQDYTGVKQVVVYPPFNADWFNVTIKGQYNISYAEANMLKKGRR